MDFEHALNSIMAEINDVAGSVDVHQAEVLAASVNAAAAGIDAGGGSNTIDNRGLISVSATAEAGVILAGFQITAFP